MLTDRELATLILVGALVALALVLPKWRKTLLPAVAGVVRAFFGSASIPLVFGFFIAYCAGWVVVAWLLGLWDLSLLKDSIIILGGVGFPILFHAVQAKSGTEIVRKIRRETIGASTFLVFYLNLESFPLWGELIFQPVFVVVGLLAFMSGTRPEWKRTQGCFSVLLVLAVLGVIVWTTVQTVVNFGETDWGQVFRELALSIWLPVIMFPFLYAVAFYAACDSIFKRVRLFGDNPPRRIYLAVFLGLRLSVRWGKEFNGRYDKRVARLRTFRDAVRGMREFRADVLDRREKENTRLAVLEARAGEPGADREGVQMDRREFYVTKERLWWIWTCQAGRYENNGKRYWDDITDMIVDAEKYGLPAAHGFVVEVTPDRKRWRAHRTLPSGWVLGIAGMNHNAQFMYSGATTPTTWPESEEWTDASRQQWPPDWDHYDGSRL